MPTVRAKIFVNEDRVQILDVPDLKYKTFFANDKLKGKVGTYNMDVTYDLLTGMTTLHVPDLLISDETIAEAARWEGVPFPHEDLPPSRRSTDSVEALIAKYADKLEYIHDTGNASAQLFREVLRSFVRELPLHDLG